LSGKPDRGQGNSGQHESRQFDGFHNPVKADKF